MAPAPAHPIFSQRLYRAPGRHLDVRFLEVLTSRTSYVPVRPTSQLRPYDTNPTWRDLKQYAWGLLSVTPFIAVAAFGARILVGSDAALWLGIGVLGFAWLAYGSVAAACIAISCAVDAVRWAGRRYARRS